MVLLKQEEILELIPNRAPFLLIDEVSALDPGKKVTTRTFIREDATWAAGHYPNKAVMPAGIVIEMINQSGLICVCSIPENRGRGGIISRIKKAKFKRDIVPGEIVTVDIEIKKMSGNNVVCKGIVKIEGNTAAEAVIKFVLQKN